MYFKPQQFKVKILIDETSDEISATAACSAISRADDAEREMSLMVLGSLERSIANAKDERS